MGTLASELGPLAAERSEGPRVYVDANVPAGAVNFMRQTLGWDVLFVLDEPEFRRAHDVDHFHRARDLGRTLVTLDHDFLDDRRFPPEHSPGVIVCSAPDERALQRLLTAIDKHVLRPAAPSPPPLAGRKVEYHPDSFDD